MIAQKNGGGTDAVLLRNLNDGLVLEQRRPGAAQRAVGRDVDPLCVAKVDDLLLGEKRVVLDLVGGGHDGGSGEQLLQVLDRVVRDADGLDLVRVGLDELL